MQKAPPDPQTRWSSLKSLKGQPLQQTRMVAIRFMNYPSSASAISLKAKNMLSFHLVKHRSGLSFSVMPKVAAIFGVVTVGSERNKFRTDVAFLSISSDFLPDVFRNVTLRFQKRQDQSRSVGQSRSKLFFNLWFLQSLIFPYVKDIQNTGTGMFTDTRDKSTLYYMFREIFISFLLFESMVAKR